MNIVSVRLSKLKQHPRNVRRHDNRNLDAIKHSLSRFGQQTPIVIDKEYQILKGNGTYLAAKDIGWKSLSCIRTELDGASAEAYAIMDNRSSDLSRFDWSSLIQVMDELEKVEGVSFEDMGFQEYEAQSLIDADSLAQEYSAEQEKTGKKAKLKLTQLPLKQFQMNILLRAKEIYCQKVGGNFELPVALVKIAEQYIARERPLVKRKKG